MIESILVLMFSLLLIFYIYFIAGIYQGLGQLKKNGDDKLNTEFVTIIIPFRNEMEHLSANLKSLESQNYPQNKYEIIYVDDASTDDSVQLLEREIKNNNIKVISVPENYSSNAHKKGAIRLGIENAKGEIIITSDADCIYHINWLHSLLKYMDENTAFISGPVEYFDTGNIFGKLQKIEFASLVITGAGLIGINKPVICNAANIAYRKKVFKEVNGFYDQMELSSGDDELLMQKIWLETNYKIKFCPEKEAVVRTAPNITISQFYQQRKRWASKGLFYGNKVLVMKLLLIYLFYLSLPFQLIIGIIISPIYLLTLAISLFLKVLFEYLVLKKGTDLLFDTKILRAFFPSQILHIPYIIIAGISGVFGNFTWKERKLSR
jgi:cellulose synthase/poly-beta-1,6-N-acetylglucosamine synthase-like glycosyltransferase